MPFPTLSRPSAPSTERHWGPPLGATQSRSLRSPSGTAATSASSTTDPRCSPTPAADPTTFSPSPHCQFFPTCARHHGQWMVSSCRPDFHPKRDPRRSLVLLAVFPHRSQGCGSLELVGATGQRHHECSPAPLVMGCQPKDWPANCWAWPDLAQSAHCTLFLSSELFDSNSS
jgi:hypothetical protein